MQMASFLLVQSPRWRPRPASFQQWPWRPCSGWFLRRWDGSHGTPRSTFCLLQSVRFHSHFTVWGRLDSRVESREREVDTLDIRRRHRERASSAAAVLHSVVRACCSAFLCTVVSARTTNDGTSERNRRSCVMWLRSFRENVRGFQSWMKNMIVRC